MPQPKSQSSTSASSLARDAHIDRERVSAALARCLDELLPKTHFTLTYTIRQEPEATAPGYEHPEVSVDFSGADQELLLQQNAELLKALEYIALRWIKLDPQLFDRVRFDSGGYRALRIEELRLSAHVAADRVRETKAPFRFNPMSARERRIVHLALQEETGVRTASEGDGEERQVVVYPAAPR
ncbi:MAG: R3H domain-containing nucleic acid-binding protein [Candidatus Acidiferrales bacterium]